MSLTIAEPSQIVNGLLTKAIAVRSQLLYPMAREDVQFTAISAGGAGEIVLSMATGGFNIGSSVYVGADTGDYSGANIIIDINTGVSLTVSGTFVATSTGYVNALTDRVAYHIAIDIFSGAGVKQTTSPLKFVPPQSGLINIDLGATLTVLTSINGPFSFEYFLEVTEVFGGSSESPATTLTLQAIFAKEQLLHTGGALMRDNLLAEFSAYQAIGDWGTNEPGTTWFPDLTQDPTVQRVTLTSGQSNIVNSGSTQPQLIAGVTYRFECIVGVGITGTQESQIELWQFRETFPWGLVESKFKGGSDNGINSKDTVVFTWTPGTTVDRFGIRIVLATATEIQYRLWDVIVSPAPQPTQLLTVFENPLFWRRWNRTVSFLMDIEFQNRTGFTEVTVEQNSVDINKDNAVEIATPVFDDTVRVVSVKLTEADGFFNRVTIMGNSNAVAEEDFFEMKDECPNPIMLDWINSLGGIEQWLFSITQTVSTQSGEGVVIEIPITGDIANITRTKQRFPGPTVQQITLEVIDLTRDQLRALNELKETDSLRVYLTKDGTEFIDAIVVQDFGINYRTKDERHRFRVTIEFPDDFDFFSAKKY